MTTRLHSNSGIANLFGLLPKSLPSKVFRYGLNIAAKETHLDVDFTYRYLSLGTSHGEVKLSPARTLGLNSMKSIYHSIDQKSSHKHPKLPTINETHLKTRAKQPSSIYTNNYISPLSKKSLLKTSK